MTMHPRTFLLFAALVLAIPVMATAAEIPEFADVLRVLTLRDYNTRVVVAGTTLLGAASGVVGTFLLLRRRALMSDAISHATLPGIVMAFMVMTALGASGKNFAVLLLGAAIAGVLGMFGVIAIARWTRLKDDTALAVVLSTTFALGIALLGMATRQGAGNAAGLETYIYGKTASMLRADAMIIAGVAVLSIATCFLLTKEFTLLCFDRNFAAAQGWPALLLDVVLMALVVLVTVAGLQAVGLILVVAMLIVPPAAAQFWTRRLRPSMVLAGILGAASAWAGCTLSALLPNIPAGAVIVLCASTVFVASLLFGRRRGLVPNWWRRRRLTHRVGEQHLLRAMIESSEAAGHGGEGTIAIEDLVRSRAWNRGELHGALRRAMRDASIQKTAAGSFRLTTSGADDARRIARNHRLWEMYLITHADIAPSHVDRDADMVEHILDPEMIAELQAMLDREDLGNVLPPSPHVIAGPEVHR